MWHRPQLLIVMADLLFLLGALALAVVTMLGLARLPLFPVREVSFTAPLSETRRPEVERALRAVVHGGFFVASPESVREAVERLPWVRRADVRRVWPGRIEVAVEEHRAIARWGDGRAQLINAYGEVFFATSPNLPALKLDGPIGSAPEVLSRFNEFGTVLAPLHQPIRALVLSPRLAWRIELEGGMRIELGREQKRAPLRARLEQFAAAYGDAVVARGRRALAIDLRYVNGFAMRDVAAGVAVNGNS